MVVGIEVGCGGGIRDESGKVRCEIDPAFTSIAGLCSTDFAPIGEVNFSASGLAEVEGADLFEDLTGLVVLGGVL